MKNILIILGTILILVVVVFLYNQQLFVDKDNNPDQSYSQEEQEFNDSGRAKAIEDETDLWQIYDDDQSGFSIKYPHNVVFQENSNNLSLNIMTTKISELEYPGFGKEEALKNLESLSGGSYGEEFDWPLGSSKKVTRVGSKNAQDFMVLSRFEVCNVVFERRLIFYNNNYQIEITLRGDRDKIIESMPEYFKTDKENCQDERIWDFNKQNEFYFKLFQGKGSVEAQDWFDTFDDIVKTIELTSSIVDIDLIQGKWISKDDENSVIEFKGNIRKDIYDEEELDQGIFEFNQDQKKLTVTIDEDIFEYTINELTENSLIMMFLPRGNILRYTK